MRNQFTFTLGLMALMAFTSACQQGEKLPDLRTPFGVPYALHTSGEGRKPQIGEYVGVHLRYISASDSVFYDTYVGRPLYSAYTPPARYGDPMDWFGVLGLGDSATFYVSADSIFKMSDPPSFIKRTETVRATIKLVDITDEAGYRKEEAQTKRARMEPELAGLRKALDNRGLSYVESENGVLYNVERPGQNVPIKPGMKVKVHYTGMLLNGDVFDSSLERDQPFDFVINESQVIEGWHRGIPLLGEGGKGTLYLVPSLAYGARGTGKIPANSPLIFQVEVIEVIDPMAKTREEGNQIEAYLKRNNITGWERTADYVYYVVKVQGTGAQPSAGKQVSVHYTGKLLDGTKFDSSLDRGQPFTFTLGQGQVIRGWDLGIPLFNVGGKGTLYLPSTLAYGEQGAGAMIKPNSILAFDVEVLDVQ